ncbi:hypothetical protein D9M69_538920 [compost metagenome]
MLDRGIDLGVHRRHAAGITDCEGRLARQRVQQNAMHHPAALLRLPETTGRAADLAPILEAAFLQADCEKHHLCLGALHPRRQERQRRGYGFPADFIEGHVVLHK